MPILFSAVAVKNVVLSRFACCEGNFTEIEKEVLSKVSAQNGKCTYFHGPYLFNYITENGHFYFCITDKACQRSKAFLFLNQIKRRFGSEGRAGLLQMLADEMYRYSEDHNTIVIRKGELDELNTIGVRSSEEILGEKLLLIEDIKNLNYGTITYLDKNPEKAVTYNNIEMSGEINHHETNTKTEPVKYPHNSEFCVIYSCDKNRLNMRLGVAMILLLFAIYILDLKSFGHVFVLMLFVIFVLFR